MAQSLRTDAALGHGLRAFHVALTDAARAAASGAGGWIERDLSFAGASIRVRFAGPALVEALLPPLAHLVAPPGRASAPAATLEVWDSGSTGVPLPPVPWTRESLDPVRGEVRGLDGDGIVAFHNVHYGGISVFDPGSATGVFWVDSEGRVPWYERGSPLRTLLHLALPTGDRYLVHAGAVGEARAGILIGGRSGSGKSTTALACAGAGFGYAGDDYVLVSLEPSPVAHCIYTTAKVDPAGLARVPELARHVNDAASSREKLVLDLGRGDGGAPVRASLPLAALVLPRVGHGARSELRPLTPAEALRDLAPSTLIQMPHRGGDVLRCIGRLVRELPSYRLELGRDLPAAVELLRPLAEAA